MLASLALLPAHHIIDGFDLITDLSVAWNKEEDMVPLLAYWQRTWLHRLDYMSVSGCEDRTTNICESDNRMIQDDVKAKHPSVFFFLGKETNDAHVSKHNCKKLMPMFMLDTFQRES